MAHLEKRNREPSEEEVKRIQSAIDRRRKAHALALIDFLERADGESDSDEFLHRMLLRLRRKGDLELIALMNNELIDLIVSSLPASAMNQFYKVVVKEWTD